MHDESFIHFPILIVDKKPKHVDCQFRKPKRSAECVLQDYLEDSTTDSDSHTSNSETNHGGWSKGVPGTINSWSWSVIGAVGGSVRVRNWETRGNGDSGGRWCRSIVCDFC